VHRPLVGKGEPLCRRADLHKQAQGDALPRQIDAKMLASHGMLFYYYNQMGQPQNTARSEELPLFQRWSRPHRIMSRLKAKPVHHLPSMKPLAQVDRQIL
jgi:hypothetical protein